MGDSVLLQTKGLLDAADIGKQRLLCGPFTVTACPSRNAYLLCLGSRGNMCCSPTVKVDRLKAFFARADKPPRLLSRLLFRCVTQYLVR